MENNDLLVKHLQRRGVLETPRIAKAFRAVDRKDFVRQDQERFAYEDRPLPIGEEQTISQPTTVAIMLEHLQPMESETILDVGCGSGYTTALLSHIVGDQGRVIGLEIVPELVTFGRTNVEDYYAEQAEIRRADPDQLGLPEEAPYDRILVSAAAQQLPGELVEQLKSGGVLVVPVKSSIHVVTKLADGNYESEELRGFSFVPLR